MPVTPITTIKSLISDYTSADRLQLLKRLGSGGQAEVWLARDQMLDRLVTVKKIAPFYERDDAGEDEQLKSLRARVDIGHPAIPTLFGVVPYGDKSWLISEYVEGVPLSELLGDLGPESIYTIAKDLLSALRCLERLSLVHGDLSPNNVIIDVTGQLRLLDFESCTRVGDKLSSTATIGFSAPERHAGRVGLPTSDTWSVGAILIWLVTQRTPEIVIDDDRQPVSVMIGPAVPAKDMLGDLVNVAAAATRLDPGLRPSAADLEERMSLSYRWLEPVDRTSLATLARSKVTSRDQTSEGDSVVEISTVNLAGRLRVVALSMAFLCVASFCWFLFGADHHYYTLRIDTTRLSASTALPRDFSPAWVESIFSSHLPDQWLLLKQSASGTGLDAGDLSTVYITVNCGQGVCELLSEYGAGEFVSLDHTVILDTSDERIWRAAIKKLARSIEAL